MANLGSPRERSLDVVVVLDLERACDRHQKGKSNVDLLEQEMVSGSGTISNNVGGVDWLSIAVL